MDSTLEDAESSSENSLDAEAAPFSALRDPESSSEDGLEGEAAPFSALDGAESGSVEGLAGEAALRSALEDAATTSHGTTQHPADFLRKTTKTCRAVVPSAM